MARGRAQGIEVGRRQVIAELNQALENPDGASSDVLDELVAVVRERDGADRRSTREIMEEILTVARRPDKERDE